MAGDLGSTLLEDAHLHLVGQGGAGGHGPFQIGQGPRPTVEMAELLAIGLHDHAGDNLAAEGGPYGDGVGGSFSRTAILELHLHIHDNPYRGLTLEEVLQQVLNANRRKGRSSPRPPHVMPTMELEFE